MQSSTPASVAWGTTGGEPASELRLQSRAYLVVWPCEDSELVTLPEESALLSACMVATCSEVQDRLYVKQEGGTTVEHVCQSRACLLVS